MRGALSIPAFVLMSIASGYSFEFPLTLALGQTTLALFSGILIILNQLFGTSAAPIPLSHLTNAEPKSSLSFCRILLKASLSILWLNIGAINSQTTRFFLLVLVTLCVCTLSYKRVFSVPYFDPMTRWMSTTGEVCVSSVLICSVMLFFSFRGDQLFLLWIAVSLLSYWSCVSLLKLQHKSLLNKHMEGARLRKGQILRLICGLREENGMLDANLKLTAMLSRHHYECMVENCACDTLVA